jgi:NAD(P)-dependent dehydrogenase (short-subunit alcohol dehydrogenase family)
MKRLDGRVAVITGAGSGIGRATAVALAEKGCDLALADVDGDGLAETAALVRGGATVSRHVVDVADAASMDRFADEVVARHGGCQVLVNNAGVATAGRFQDDTLEDLEWIIGVNLWGVVHGVRSFLPLLRTADEAHIVNLSSMVAFVGLPQNAAYSLTKGAVRSFTEALRGEVRGDGIGVTCVHPGAIRTNIMVSARGSQAARLADLSRSRIAALAMRPPDAVARRIVAAIERDRARTLVGPDARALDLFARVVPSRSAALARAVAALER